MTQLRWPTRQITASIADWLRGGLTGLGWFDPANTFAEHMPITFEPDHDPDQVIRDGGPRQPNLVGLSFGDIPDYVVVEIGGGLQSVDIPAFIDIWAEDRGVAMNLADDITGILQGELWAPSRFIPLYDHSVTPNTLIVDRACEARLVVSRWPTATGTPEWRQAWRLVAWTNTIWWTGAGND